MSTKINFRFWSSFYFLNCILVSSFLSTVLHVDILTACIVTVWWRRSRCFIVSSRSRKKRSLTNIFSHTNTAREWIHWSIILLHNFIVLNSGVTLPEGQRAPKACELFICLLATWSAHFRLSTLDVRVYSCLRTEGAIDCKSLWSIVINKTWFDLNQFFISGLTLNICHILKDMGFTGEFYQPVLMLFQRLRHK